MNLRHLVKLKTDGITLIFKISHAASYQLFILTSIHKRENKVMNEIIK